MDELKDEYLKVIPTDPLSNWSYNYTNMAANSIQYTKSKCDSYDWQEMAELTYYPEIKRKSDIVRACPDNRPWDYVVSHGQSINRYFYLRRQRLFDDKYAPTGSQS